MFAPTHLKLEEVRGRLGLLLRGEAGVGLDRGQFLALLHDEVPHQGGELRRVAVGGDQLEEDGVAVGRPGHQMTNLGRKEYCQNHTLSQQVNHRHDDEMYKSMFPGQKIEYLVSHLSGRGEVGC